MIRDARHSLLLALLAGALGAGTSCAVWDPEPAVNTYELVGKHTDASCEACHGEPPFGAISTRCDACHEVDRPVCAANQSPPCHYEDQVDAAVEALTSLIEPMLIVFLGVMIGFIVVSMFMPMFKMIEAVM